MRITEHKRRYLWLAAAVIWMALIFHFSNQKAVKSSEISGSLTYRIAKGIDQAFCLDFDEDTLKQYAQALEHPVRKAAHMTEYAVLAWIFLGNCMQYPYFRRKCYIWAGMLAALYAATDEFHQLFIEGRSGELKDVAIDSTGALLGLLLAFIFHKLIKNKRKR